MGRDVSSLLEFGANEEPGVFVRVPRESRGTGLRARGPKTVDKMRHKFLVCLVLVEERYHKGHEDKVLAFGQNFIVSSIIKLPPCSQMGGLRGCSRGTGATERIIEDVKAELEKDGRTEGYRAVSNVEVDGRKGRCKRKGSQMDNLQRYEIQS